MAVIIDSSGRLQQDPPSGLALNCPHCAVMAQLTPVSIPDFNQLQRHKPPQVGIVYRCESCNAPVFLRYAVRVYGGSRVELSPSFVELERPREKFSFTHLPEDVELMFREALACFSTGCLVAFAAMCRRTAQSVFSDLGEDVKLSLYDQVAAVRRMADIDDLTFNLVRQVIFGSDQEPRSGLPVLDDYQAGVLLEIMKDLLYQAYVRRGRLQQALMVRRQYREEPDSAKVTPLDRARS
ncbi:MAG: hypothetical protein ACO3IZ_05580 [Steroidobacteraceae bacterium]